MSGLSPDVVPTTILLDIYERLGVIETKQDHTVKQIDKIDREVEEIKPVAKKVSELEPVVKDLQLFKSRIGAIVFVAGTVLSAALYLLWQGISYFSTEIKAALGRLFH
jgi:lipid II:glycine glycyltransferase (peptidoglycan interpeptide bridge formation enzyme)